MNIDTYVKLALSTLAGIAAYIWGPWDALLAALVIMVAIASLGYDGYLALKAKYPGA